MKLPVFKAIAMTFAFTLQHWLQLLRILWVPVGLLVLATSLYEPHLLRYALTVQGVGGGSGAANAALLEFLPYLVGMWAVSGLLGCVMAGGVLKLVLRGERPAVPFYLRFGMDEWRLFLTSLVYVCIFLGLQLATFVVVAIAAALANAFGSPVSTIIAIVLGLTILLVFLRLMLRLSLASAASIAQRRVGVAPSAEATQDNEWRLLGYWILWALIAFFAGIGVTALLVPEALETYLYILNPGSFDAYLAQQKAAIAFATNFDPSTVMGIVRLCANWIFTAIQFAFGLVAVGVAWRLLTDQQREQEAGTTSATATLGF